MSNFDGTGYGNYSNGDFDNGQQSSQRQFAPQTLTPVSIKMLNEIQVSGDSAFHFNSMELSSVKFIGVLRNIEPSESSDSLDIEDGTGKTISRIWKNGDDMMGEGFQEPPYSVNDYVAVTASLREFNNKIQHSVTSINKITDFNEIPYHFLNVTYHYLKSQGKLGSSMAKTELSSNSNSNSNSNNDNKNGNLFVSDNNTSASGSLDGQILQLIKDASKHMSEGVSIDYIKQNLPNFNPSEVQNSVNDLSYEGIIFTTSDDDHYLPV
ncbi:Rfa2 protein [Martiniozyma asiatica (nom. inval.)]|nr:Rfa2 protein [Martiniozyma asiatica]